MQFRQRSQTMMGSGGIPRQQQVNIEIRGLWRRCKCCQVLPNTFRQPSSMVRSALRIEGHNVDASHRVCFYGWFMPDVLPQVTRPPMDVGQKQNHYLLGLNMVKYLVGTERARAHACSDTLRQGESPKVSAHGAPGLRARIRPCSFQFSLPSADCVVRRTGQRLFARDSPDAPWV